MNASKSNWLFIWRTASSFNNAYFASDNDAMSSVSCIKDLGVIIGCDLSFSKNVDDITRRAYQRTCMIYKGFVSRDKIMLSKAYATSVRPLLEYCTQIWSPTYVTDIVKIEKVQKYYTKRISSISNLSYKQRLQCLKLDSLELRRLYFDMRIVYTIIQGLIDVAFDDLFTFSPNRSTRGYVYKLYCSKSNLNVRSNFSHNAISQHGTLYQMMLIHLRL